MKNRRWLAFTALALLLMTGVGFAASTAARTFMDGIDAYRKGDWPAAVTAFKHIADSGVDNGKWMRSVEASARR